ncbi:TetR/AcrR family transcriptional regulator C-terminal domain-containing protein [Streptomyces viridochromogenes]|uniref:Putative transcriptional regulator n=1 Tax=Streptomyces viridochromogenes Tue57 TaxID=1160705 RepID=L8PR77_STRVR|nr:TetR/AcrR family transcriptional regulator C-terminal domain-containing protein [Streptomyces viridochromogenes]ELS58518.1 putative transcriptional regulator [Streptomyces viridochromogenes Tue57]
MRRSERQPGVLVQRRLRDRQPGCAASTATSADLRPGRASGAPYRHPPPRGQRQPADRNDQAELDGEHLAEVAVEQGGGRKQQQAGLAAAELHRFPELGEAWKHRGTESHHPAVAGALRALAEQGRLEIPDLLVAIIQFYGLLVFPHMVFSSYGTHIDEDLTDRLLTSGVDMFLDHYGPRDG